ncbi:hypothetical protein Naga_101684g1 [Nannochloropsis gaditana]|uniref:Uncharacterized protein n=1 Tax=Nannochloropsis gaditana TaxID=72520 RepID=W7TBT8_9STRA|nr:hypothetical protein Naga_101684g1 [Nannochloropsis gaditana]
MGGAPWYVYASGVVGLGLIGKVISDAANKAIGEYEEGEWQTWQECALCRYLEILTAHVRGGSIWWRGTVGPEWKRKRAKGGGKETGGGGRRFESMLQQRQETEQLVQSAVVENANGKKYL